MFTLPHDVHTPARCSHSHTMVTLPHDGHTPTRCSHSHTMFTLPHDVHTPTRCPHSHTMSTLPHDVHTPTRCSHSHTMFTLPHDVHTMFTLPHDFTRVRVLHLPKAQGSYGVTKLRCDFAMRQSPIHHPTRERSASWRHARLGLRSSKGGTVKIDCESLCSLKGGTVINRL
jgi:hypothetical protein